MSTPIIQIWGIGERTADILVDYGYTNAEDLAATTVDALARVPGFGPSRAKLVIKSARDLVGGKVEGQDVSSQVTPAADKVDIYIVGDKEAGGAKKKNKKKKKTKESKKSKNEKKQKKAKKVKKTESKQKKQKKDKKKKKK